MKKHFRSTAWLLALPLLVQGCGGGEPEAHEEAPPTPEATTPAPPIDAEGATVTILSPTEGEVVTGPSVMVRLAATGVTIAPAVNHDPGTGHHHIFINRDVTPLTDSIPAGVSDIRHLGQGQTEFQIEGLAPGEHRFIAVIADWAHVPLDPPAMDTVHFTVRAP